MGWAVRLWLGSELGCPCPAEGQGQEVRRGADIPQKAGPDLQQGSPLGRRGLSPLTGLLAERPGWGKTTPGTA